VKPRTVRARTTALATLIVAIVLGFASVLVVTLVARALLDNLDRTLEQRADEVDAAARTDRRAPLPNSNDEDRFAQIVIVASGELVATTPNLTGVPALADPPAGERAATTRDDLPLEDDAYRVLTHRFGDRYVIVGENVDDVRDGVRALAVTLAVVAPIAVALLALAVWWLAGRTLRPVEAIRAEAARIGFDRVGGSVVVPDTDDEVARLAVTMNEMLARLASAADRERAFVGDASHELRTPLTRLRTTLEVELEHGTDPISACRRALDDTVEMQALVDDLLFLARHDAAPTDRAPTDRATDLIDVDAIVAAEIELARRDLDPAITIDASHVGAAMARGDVGHLARAVRNVLSNAARHARSRVVVTVAETPTGSAIVVDDDGPGIAADQRDRVFERFVRLDEARTGDSGGSGLGLAIARDVVVAHGGSIIAGDAPTGGARFTITLPTV
jgi:signal transduction histidine kinase